MADQVKELFHKTFTATEISSGTTYNFTTDANTGYVIKDIQAKQSSTSPTKVSATASIGTTTDFNATPSKYIDLGTVASATVEGATGSEIMDSSSTFSIRVPAQPVAFSDIVHSQLTYQSNSNITEVTGVTPTVNGQSESALSPVSLTTTQVDSNYYSQQSDSNAYQWRQLVENPITGVKVAVNYINNTNNNHHLLLSGYDTTSAYYNSVNSQYQPFEFDGRFVYNMNGTTHISYYDTKGSAARAPTSWPHGSLRIANSSGNNMSTLSSGTTYPRLTFNHLTDTGNGYLVVQSGYTHGLYLIKLPSYDGTDGAALPNNTKTEGFWQLNNYNWSTSTGMGPTSNRWNPAHIQNNYGQNNQFARFYIGSTAASTTKRILFFQDGNTTDTSNYLYFFVADEETMETAQNNSGSYHAYSIPQTELESDFGWATNNTRWDTVGGVAARIRCNQFQTLTGSSAKWGTESGFYLDKDVMTFTNVASAGTGEGPIIQWNLKTNTVTAPITWAQYVDSNGTSLNNPGGADSLVAHRTFVSTPTSSEIAARTYTKTPSLSIRATGIKEDRS